MSITPDDLMRAIEDAGLELYSEQRDNLLKLDGYLDVERAVEILNTSRRSTS